MHALAIEVDPAAYRAVKLEACQREATIPKLIGEILRETSVRVEEVRASVGPAWRRTGEGRRARQHTRIDLDDTTWATVHLNAIRQSVTVARCVGRAVEAWVADRAR